VPAYDYHCPFCGAVETKFVPYADRMKQRCDVCAEPTEWQFPVEAALGFKPWGGDYYDEALDGDITGREDRKLFLKASGLIEAGDKVRGGRNFDKHAPDHIKPRKPRGVSVWESKAKNDREVAILEKRREAIGE